MPSHKPDGHSTVSPYLIVEDARRTIAFLCEVFDAAVLREFPDANGRLMHSEVRIDDTVVMIADSAPNWPAMAAHVHVYVPDVDATYAHALKSGGSSVQVPTKKGDEDKRGGVRDPGGTTWWIGTRVE